jgi:hypothetical protein
MGGNETSVVLTASIKLVRACFVSMKLCLFDIFNSNRPSSGNNHHNVSEANEKADLLFIAITGEQIFLKGKRIRHLGEADA